MRVLPIASGKGGVGKTMLAANLALALAEAGKKVVLADLDLGASNLHLVIGHRAPRAGVSSFLNDFSFDFESLIVDTDIPNLRLLPGDAEIPGSANLKASQKNALSRRLLGLDADVLVLDLGAGTHQSILDFFLLSSRGIVITDPSLSATLNAYLFLKNAVFRLMYASFTKKSEAYRYIESLRKDGSSLQRVYVPTLMREIEKIDAVSHKKFKDRLALFQPRLIMNMINDPKDAEKAQKIRRSCAEYLDIQLEHMGIIYRDTLQDRALSSRLPILKYKPQSIISQAIYRIADKVLQSEEDLSAFDDLTLDESFQEAKLEAEIDFETRMSYVEELLHSGSLTEGELNEVVKSQQFEITQLRKENLFLKSKVAKAISEGFAP